MASYDMGFATCEKPLTKKEQTENLLTEFIGSGDSAMSRDCGDLSTAKGVQSALSAVIRKEFADKGISCKRVDSIVYVVKGE